ncbi:MAG TPA: hypothetical protein VMV14_08665 [Acidimicrobiales bacterium]|nr:hypothetical protein [Acidimicrobiales bacterium]
MSRRKRAAFAASSIGIVAVAIAAWAGVSAAVSGGGYNPNQQDCPWTDSAWNTPSNPADTYPGCHNVAVNVESGGTTNGDPNSTNTRYAEFGNNQSPNISGNPGFGFLLNIGDPGTYDGIHSGCLAANTDGTNGGNGVGCGNNPNGTGFQLNYDYYQVYCPAASLLPLNSVPDTSPAPGLHQCAADQPIGTNSPQIDTGTNNQLSTILTQGLLVYFGMDDNTDNGEHDGFSGLNNTNGAINGTSDGGGFVLSLTPQNAQNTPTATNPEGLLNFSMGFCADGICGEGTTQQQTVYYGCINPNNSQTTTWTNNGVDGATNPQNNQANDQCAKGTPQSSNVYQNSSPASQQESSNCSSGDNAGETACQAPSNPNGANGLRQSTPQQMNAEPGIQTYQDPDPQRSPAAPFATPGLYVGTCGVYVSDNNDSVGPGVVHTFTGGNVNAPPGGYIGPNNC